MPRSTVKPSDEFVIFYSKEDGCWIAHGLHTDQLGTGQSVVDALADGMLAVQQVYEAARRDKTLAFQREAPPDIQQKRRDAKRLPREIYEIAHKKVHGQWPDEFRVNNTAPTPGQAFTTSPEMVPC